MPNGRPHLPDFHAWLHALLHWPDFLWPPD